MTAMPQPFASPKGSSGGGSHLPWRLISFVLVLAVVATSYLCFFHKNDEEKVKAVLATYTQAYKDRDVDKMISCLDPRTQAMFKIIAGISSKIVGFDVLDMLNLATDGLGDYLNSDLPDFQIIVHSIQFPTSNTANVDVDFVFGSTDQRVSVPMGRDDANPFKSFFENTWYIKLM